MAGAGLTTSMPQGDEANARTVVTLAAHVVTNAMIMVTYGCVL